MPAWAPFLAAGALGIFASSVVFVAKTLLDKSAARAVQVALMPAPDRSIASAIVDPVASTAWTAIPTSDMSMSIQCMAFDDQLDVRPRTILSIIRANALFFERVVLNRMYLLNNPALKTLFEGREMNGVLDLMRARALVLIKSPTLSLADDWKRASQTASEAITRDADFVAELSDDLDQAGAAYVPFDLSSSTERFHRLISDIWLRLQEDFRLQWVAPSDREQMDEFFGVGSPVPRDFRRAVLLRPPATAYPWGLDIPRRTSEGSDSRFVAMERLAPRNQLSDSDRALFSKAVLKQIVDLAYNANLPVAYGMPLAHHDVWSNIRQALSSSRMEPYEPEVGAPSLLTRMVDLNRMSLSLLALLLRDEGLGGRKADFQGALMRAVNQRTAEDRWASFHDAADALATLASYTATWADQRDIPIVTVRVGLELKRYLSHEPASAPTARTRVVISVVAEPDAGAVPLVELEMPFNQAIASAGEVHSISSFGVGFPAREYPHEDAMAGSA